ncbi:hypothetical protein L6R52_07620 [Myxococcota bacterium]|nr:hypothetical protein [Myxococcota bacterium]
MSDASRDHFDQHVLPVFEERCGLGCHGIPADDYTRVMRHPDTLGYFYFPVDPRTGRVSSSEELRRMAFDVARGAWHDGGHEASTAIPRVDYQAAPEYSGLLLQPLAEELGGLTHGGVSVFSDVRDPGYQVLNTWLAIEIAAHREPPPTPSTARRYFRDEVVGVLERNGCFIASCHGANVFNDLKLVRPLPRSGADPSAPLRLSPRMLAANHAAVLGTVARLANLGGDLTRSRLIVKNLPIEVGGVHQRGGNIQFFSGYDDPDVQTLLTWMALEREELAQQLTSGGKPLPAGDLGRVRGVAFLRGPRHAPRRFFELEAFWPGTRLMLLPDGAAAPHVVVDVPGAELQAFDVRYDARAIVFSMRTRADEGYRIYEVELDAGLRPRAGSLRRLSAGPEHLADGTPIHHIDPVYIPEWSPRPVPGLDTALDRVAIAFASNAAGTYAASEPFAWLGEADGGDTTSFADRQRTESPGTFDGRRVHFIDGGLERVTRRIVRHRAGGRFELDRPLPTAPRLGTHYEIERRDARYLPAFDIWRFLPGKFAETATRMTFTNAQERRPTSRATGEVMFTSVRNRGYQAHKPIFNGAIYRAQAGGFDYHIQGGNRSRHLLYSDSRELPSGLEIRLALDPRNRWGGGALVLADHGFGVNIEPDNPVDHVAYTAGGEEPSSSSVRFLPTQHLLLPDTGPMAVTSSGDSPGGSFRDPYPMPDESLLVARTVRALDHASAHADPDWDVYELSFAGRRLQAADGKGPGKIIERRLDAASSAEAETSPRPIVVRLKERSVTHQKFAARADGRAPAPVDGVLRYPPGEPGEIECYDFPLLQSFLETFAPVGPKDLREQELRFVRILRQLPSTKEDVAPVRVPGADVDPFARRVSVGIHERSEIVAEIPLEPDGSFYARVPSNVPLLVQGLDEGRRAIVAMARWFYVQPGEKLTFSIPRPVYTTRCSGCHGSLTGRPEDALGRPDLVTAASRVMSTWSRATGRRSPDVQQPITVDFRRDVQPILDRRCVSCHSGPTAPAPDLRGESLGPYTVAYVALHTLETPGSGNFADKRWVDERQALASSSHLVEKLIGRELHSPRRLTTPGVAHATDLEPAELLTLTRWIDLGATFLGGQP